MANQQAFSSRALTSLMSAAGLLVMGVSGLVAYIMPHGRVAYWTDWHFWGLSKTQWGDIHIISSILFMVAAGFHLYLNWKPFKSYLKAKAASARARKKELLVTLAAMVLVVVSGIAALPPLSWISELSAFTKDAWVVAPAYEPPFGHAEELALGTFCKKMRIPPQAALDELRAKGYQVPGLKTTVLDIARMNGQAPMLVYQVIQHLEPKPQAPAGKAYTAQNVEETFAGTGIGNKTISAVAAASGVDLGVIRRRLKAKGLAVADDQTMKQAATANDLASPLELMKAMLVEDYQPPK